MMFHSQDLFIFDLLSNSLSESSQTILLLVAAYVNYRRTNDIATFVARVRSISDICPCDVDVALRAQYSFANKLLSNFYNVTCDFEESLTVHSR